MRRLKVKREKFYAHVYELLFLARTIESLLQLLLSIALLQCIYITQLR